MGGAGAQGRSGRGAAGAYVIERRSRRVDTVTIFLLRRVR